MKRGLLAVIVLTGSCAPTPPPQVSHGPEPRHYLIPIEALNGDYVCAETAPHVPTNFCVTVGAFRIWVSDPKVEP
jgi:hypothetical protein